jgi:hypothetical protein
MIGWQRWFVFCFVAAAVIVWAWLNGLDHGRASEAEAWAKKWDAQTLAMTQAHNRALQAAREEEQLLIKTIEVIQDESKKQIDAARADAAAADLAAVGLHEQARRMAARASQCSGTATATDRGAAARATDAAVLAELFQRADRTAGQLAAAYDRARAAGLTCERAYDAARNARTVP